MRLWEEIEGKRSVYGIMVDTNTIYAAWVDAASRLIVSLHFLVVCFCALEDRERDSERVSILHYNLQYDKEESEEIPTLIDIADEVKFSLLSS